MLVENTVHIWSEGGRFVAHAMPLDVMNFGETAYAARQALEEAVRVFLVTAREMGTLDTILEECGYTRTDRGWGSPKCVTTERQSIAL